MHDWQFWIDRGGTFTDVIGLDNSGGLQTLKLLSERKDHYADAAIEGIRRILADSDSADNQVASVRMGTTVATNALLERAGEPTVLLTTSGLADALRIGTQQRPEIFALDITVPTLLYSEVVEAHERLSADGDVIVPLDETRLREDLCAAAQRGFRSLAVVLMHAWQNSDHELRAAAIAAEVGFTQISMSHDVSPTMRIVPRGETTLADAYLTPVLTQHISAIDKGLDDFAGPAKLEFMQSHGGLTAANKFRGCNSVLSGPAGGVVGMSAVAADAGFERVIGFDMGGTSTDVALYAGQFERTNESVLAGVRIATPMLHIHTIAAGGGSLIDYVDGRLTTGPESAGASPGPAAYRNGGPLTLTDANMLLGRIQPAYFPAVFGPNGDETLDLAPVQQKFSELAARSGLAPQELAEGALSIAVENMAQAIAQISTRRGIDLDDFVLCAFGGAGGQHACRVAESLGITTVLIHPLAGLLSALGIGVAEQRRLQRQTIELPLSDANLRSTAQLAATLAAALTEKNQTDAATAFNATTQLHIKTAGADTTVPIPLTRDSSCAEITAAFNERHTTLFGFAPQGQPVIESVEVELASKAATPRVARTAAPAKNAPPLAHANVHFAGQDFRTPILRRDGLAVDSYISGPAIVVEQNSTTVIEPGWRARRDSGNNLILERAGATAQSTADDAAAMTAPDPVRLEIFNNAFMHAAEQMGVILQRAAHSVNIKERMDFSCAVFSATGELIANAPHVPVHLGSMGEAVKALLVDHGHLLRPGSVLMTNDPLRGGTHLPDVTVVTSVHFSSNEKPDFIVASRAHHADVGGMTPGSMPPFSRTQADEGALFHGVQIVRDGKFRPDAVIAAFSDAVIPAREPSRNVADIQAQIAANARGIAELRRLVERYGAQQCQRYVRYMYENAAQAVRNALQNLHGGSGSADLDGGERIQLTVDINHDTESVHIDFSGTSPESSGNLNAPAAVAKSAVLYTLRVLVAHDIPLNSGCLEPIELSLPPGTLINPAGEAAVVGGNVETSQRIVDALFRAFGMLASSQGTMNNVTFGNDRLQYYETICGGAGASATADGADAVHSHMTNSRLTDPEVLEWRFPVRLRRFSVRGGSGGAGRNRGGHGVVREIEFLATMTVAVLSNCRRIAPHGIAGGKPGETGRNAILRRDGAVEDLGGTGQAEVESGDVLSIATPGGGGFGVQD